MLYNVVLVSAIHQHKSAIGRHMCPPSWTSLPPATPSHRSQWLQSTVALPVLCSNFPVAVLHMEMYMFQCWALNSSPLHLPPLCPKSVLYVCVSVVVQLPSRVDSLQPHGLQHARLPCPLPSPRVSPSSCLLNRWCHPIISSSQGLFHWGSGSFPLSQLYASGDQSIGASALASVFPMKGWFPLRLIVLIFLLSKGCSRVFSTTVQRHRFFCVLSSLWSSSHIHTCLLERPQPWLYGPLSAKWCLSI